MPKSKPKILLAVGGTGGHLFPAQALARDLQNAGVTELLFAGHGLTTNRYFKRELFSYEDVKSATPRKGLRAIFEIGKGFLQSRRLLKRFQPDLVVGFGSFHSFPLLLAAKLAKIPFVLFMPDAVPGQVNRFFSRWARFTGTLFPETGQRLKGEAKIVEMPVWCKTQGITREEARRQYGLDPNLLTLLVFGGSQGAEPINSAVGGLELKVPFQVIHFSGKEGEAVRDLYAKRGIRAYVAAFEENMERAYRAADLAICRSGAATLGELAAFELPALLIPWPGAADNHQQINAKIFVERTGGGQWLAQNALTSESLSKNIDELNFDLMKQNLRDYKIDALKGNLAELILKL